MLATILTRAQFGMDAPLVTVDVHVTSGLPCTSIVGLPEAGVKESKDRVRSAIMSAGYQFPAGRIIVNLAPADLPKEGGRYDLPIALGLLAATRQIPTERLRDTEFFGELSLGGQLRPITGILPAAYHASKSGHLIVIPAENLEEAQLLPNARTAIARNLIQVCEHLTGRTPLSLNTVTQPQKKLRPASKPLRRTRSTAGAACTRDCCCRRSRDSAAWTAWCRQDDARHASSRHPPTHDTRRGTRDGSNHVGQRQRIRSRRLGQPSLPCPSP